MKILKPKPSATKIPEIKTPKKLHWSKINVARVVAKIKEPTKPNWFKLSVIANIAIIAIAVIGLGGGVLLHQTDTNPNFCSLCHVMQTNVSSYLTSNHMDNIHMQAGVQCKDCHNYPVTTEITSGVNFLIGNYQVDTNGELIKRKYDDAMCMKWHLTDEHLKNATDYLHRNPHNSHWGDMPCSSCHISHGVQFDYCSQCHDNGGQRMIDQPIEARGTISN